VTGIPEYPFNDDHMFMQESSREANVVDNDVEIERDVETDTETDHEDRDDARFTKEEQTDSYDNEEDSTLMLRQPKQHYPPADSREPMSKGLMSRPLHLSRQPTFRASSSKSASAPSSQATQIKPITKNRADAHSINDIPALISHKLLTIPPSRVLTRNRNSTPTKSPYFARTRKQGIIELPRPKSQPYKDFTLRVPIDEPRWSTTNFQFAVVRSIYTLPV
jgi:hypothetical protein